jgi:type III restriction enzyme
MPADSFRLFTFQEEAAEALRSAALDWVAYCARAGTPRYGATEIPFLGQLKAVTGSGKTPVLAEAVGGLGDSVVLWTTRSSAVVEQTFANLNGRYNSLLPPGTRVIRDVPSQALWRELIDSEKGQTIWVLTVASWNEADAEAANGDARLRLRRPQPDWAGEGSPWDQLRDDLKRPLWVVSDESHNQTGVQLDQLAGLRPRGFFMASATPVVNDLFTAWQGALEAGDETRRLFEAAHVPIETRDVVDANLLKTTIEVIDYRSGAEESLDGALGALARVDEAVAEEGASITPRAIYVVERSNPPRGSQEESRPGAIWLYLVERGVRPEEIAVFTDTKTLPEGARRVSSLSQLDPQYRHIIFNQALQEGWDDPEAYVCYFDGVTRSFVRIRQIVGRVLRQPTARRFKAEALNTASLIIQTPGEAYDQVISGLRAELRLYAPDDDPAFTPVRIKTRKEPLTPIPLKPGIDPSKLELVRQALQAPGMRPIQRKMKGIGDRPWPPASLEAPGTGRRAVVSLETGSERLSNIEVLRSARTQNGAFLRRRILQRNRTCANAIHPDWFKGEAFEQWSCHGSIAQEELAGLAAEIVDYFEDRVGYGEDPDPDRRVWRPDEYRPRGPEMVDFERAAHARYSRNDFNTDELAFARALDRIQDVLWLRNPPTANQGFGIPLPKKVGDSSTFYPDFLAWFGETCWAIDTTGRHLLDEKVRGKLVGLGVPRMALVVRGEVDLGSGSREGKQGWSVVIGRPNLKPIVEHSDDLEELLSKLRSEDA